MLLDLFLKSTRNEETDEEMIEHLLKIDRRLFEEDNKTLKKFSHNDFIKNQNYLFSIEKSLQYLNDYLKYNNNDVFNDLFNKWLNETITNEIFNEDFLKAVKLLTSEYKLLNMYKTRPFGQYTNFVFFYWKVIDNTTGIFEYNLYESLLNKLDNIYTNPHLFPLIQINNLFKNNDYLRKIWVHKKYRTLSEEYEELNNIVNDYENYSKTFRENKPEYNFPCTVRQDEQYFMDDLKRLSDVDNKIYEEISLIQNDILGKVGELFMMEVLKQDPEIKDLTLVAKDLGDGFGYDIYFKYNNKEYLYEVKATLNNEIYEGDYFKVTSNEFAKFKKEISNPNIEYRIIRVYINTNDINNRFTYRKFRIDENTKDLIDIENSNNIYYNNSEDEDKDQLYKRTMPEKKQSLTK